MKKCAEIEKLFIEYLFEGIDEEQKRVVDLHLAACPRCSEEMADMKQTMAVLGQMKRVEPSEEYWDTYWYRLEERMENKPASKAGRKRRLWQSPRSIFSMIPGPAFQWASVAAVLILGIFIGRYFLAPQGSSDVPVARMHYEPDESLSAATVADRAERYLEKSKIFLIGFVNTNGEIDESGYDMGRQREISQGLIQEAGYLKENLDSRTQQKMRALIEELETILIEIANLEEREDLPNVEMIQEGIDRKGILLKINVHQMTDDFEDKDLGDSRKRREII